MSIPMLRVLRKDFPDNKISLLCVQKNKAALQHLPFFDEIIVIDNLSNFPKNIFKLIQGRYDVVFDLEPFRKASSVIAYLSGANIRIGFDTNNRRVLYTHYVTYANEKCYESINMIRQLKVLGIHVPQDEAVDMSISLPERDLERARRILASYGLSQDNDFVVAVAPGVLKKHHRWVNSKFALLIGEILKEDRKSRILLLGASADIPDTQEVVRQVGQTKRVINLVGKTNFIEALGLLKACKILIACDGGIVYMAAAMGCGTISIWGPGVMERFKPPGDHHLGVRREYPCVPCVNYSRLGEFPKCPYYRRCITDITVGEVFDRYLYLKNRFLVRGNLDSEKEFCSTSPA